MKKISMKIRRIVAWILLAAFALLLINILFIGYELMLCIIVYVVIAGSYFFYMSGFMNFKKPDLQGSPPENKDDGSGDGGNSA